MKLDKRIEALRPAFNHDTYPSVAEGIKQLIRDVLDEVKPTKPSKLVTMALDGEKSVRGYNRAIAEMEENIRRIGL